MSAAVSFTRDGEIGVITVANPPVNALSQPVRAGLKDAVQAGLADPGVKAMVLICDGATFIAGADIREFGKPLAAPSLVPVIDAMEASDKPIVAAIHGTALGGGLEVALGCHYRVAVPSARVGLPEVNLGLLPGAGGTQRLPRLVGVEKALDFIVQGTHVPAAEAQRLGLLDELIEGDLKAGAIAFARRVLAEKR
ncbi:MAG: enoyl-CoA hydratase/isomerase family protein, partial [Porticoccaceae bacterium]